MQFINKASMKPDNQSVRMKDGKQTKTQIYWQRTELLFSEENQGNYAT